MIYRRALIAVLIFFLVACSASTLTPTPAPTPALPAALVVHADASLADALGQVRQDFSETHPELPIEFNFTAPDEMIARLDSAPSANIAASPDLNVFKHLSKQNRISSPPRILARRPLAIITARTNSKGILAIHDLDRGDLRVALARPDTHLGRRSRTLIGKLGGAPSFGPRFVKQFTQSVIVQTSSGLGIVNLIEQNRVDVGIVYATDALPKRDRILILDLPLSYNTSDNYYVATLKSDDTAPQSQPFINYLYTLRSQNILATYGFAPPY